MFCSNHIITAMLSSSRLIMKNIQNVDACLLLLIILIIILILILILIILLIIIIMII